MEPTNPPGWYPDMTQRGLERYWDGSTWTPSTRPAAGGGGYWANTGRTAAPPPVAPTYGPPGRTAPPAKDRSKPAKVRGGGGGFFKKVLGALVILAVVIVVLSKINTGGSSNSSGSVSAVTCKGIISKILDASQTNSTQNGGLTLLAIYRPKQIANHVAAFNAGKYKIPAGKNEVTLLDCRGTATLSDNSTAPVTYEMTADTNNQTFFKFQTH